MKCQTFGGVIEPPNRNKGFTATNGRIDDGRRRLFYLDMIRFAIEYVSAASGLEKRW
jgi:hypothetical protein